MSGKKGMKHYLLATKLEAVRMSQEEGKSYKEITEYLHIADPERVSKWVKEYRRKREAAFGRGVSSHLTLNRLFETLGDKPSSQHKAHADKLSCVIAARIKH